MGGKFLRLPGCGRVPYPIVSSLYAYRNRTLPPHAIAHIHARLCHSDACAYALPHHPVPSPAKKDITIFSVHLQRGDTHASMQLVRRYVVSYPVRYMYRTRSPRLRLVPHGLMPRPLRGLFHTRSRVHVCTPRALLELLAPG